MATKDKKLTEFRLPRSGAEAVALAAAFLTVVAALQLTLPLVDRLGAEPEIRSYVCAAAFACIPILFALLKRVIPKLRRYQRVRGQSSPWYVTGPIAAALLFGWNLLAAATGVVAGEFSVLATLALNATAAIVAGFLIDRRTESMISSALFVSCFVLVALNLLLNYLVEGATPAAASGNSAISIMGFWLGAISYSLFALALEGVGVAVSRISAGRSRRSISSE